MDVWILIYYYFTVYTCWCIQIRCLNVSEFALDKLSLQIACLIWEKVGGLQHVWFSDGTSRLRWSGNRLDWQVIFRFFNIHKGCLFRSESFGISGYRRCQDIGIRSIMRTLSLVLGFKKMFSISAPLINGPIVKETPRATQNIRKIITTRWGKSPSIRCGGKGGNKVNGSKNNFIRLLRVLLIRYSWIYQGSFSGAKRRALMIDRLQ